MIVGLTATELQGWIVGATAAELTLRFQDRAFIAVKVGKIVASLELVVTPLNDGSLEIDMEAVKVAGMGLFGVPRKKIADLLLEKAKNFPQITLWKNDRGNLQLSIPGCKFLSCGFDQGAVLIEVVC